MALRKLGTSGLLVSAVGLGCNNFGGRLDSAATARVVDAAIEHGINFFDTADSYARGVSESFLGEALGERRKNVVVATKFASPMDDAGKLKGASRRYVMLAVEASLKRLKTDWIDLYQYHQPDALTPMEETLRALDDLVRQGKVRYIGLSNQPGWKVVEADWIAKSAGLNRFISCQDEYSLLRRGIDAALLPALKAYELGLIPYSPLASGVLSGKYIPGAPMPEGTRLTANPNPRNERFLNPGNWQKLEKLGTFAKAHDKSMLELAFGWLLAKPFVSSVIAGAMTPEQIAANVAAGECKLSIADVAALDEMTA